ATESLKHVGESYPCGQGRRCLLTFDNHTPVNGIREFALERGPSLEYTPLTTPDLSIDRDVLNAQLERVRTALGNLFAYPAQSNFSGVTHPLDLIAIAHDRGWDVLLQGAAFVSTNGIDLE